MKCITNKTWDGVGKGGGDEGFSGDNSILAGRGGRGGGGEAKRKDTSISAGIKQRPEDLHRHSSF